LQLLGHLLEILITLLEFLLELLLGLGRLRRFGENALAIDETDLHLRLGGHGRNRQESGHKGNN